MDWNNPAQIHLLINHLPILGVFLALPLLAWSILGKKPDLARGAFLLLVLAGLGSFVATRSGEQAEELVEGQPGVTHALIHDHEERGEQTRTACLVVGGLALLGLAWPKAASSNAFRGLVVVGALVAGGLGALAGHTGGLIRHPEIRSGAPIPANSEAGGEAEVEDH